MRLSYDEFERMVIIMKKLVVLTMICVLVFTSTALSFADSDISLVDGISTSKTEIEVCNDVYYGRYIIEKTVDKNSIISIVKNEQGNILARAENIDGVVKVMDVETGNLEIEIVGKDFEKSFSFIMEKSVTPYISTGDVRGINWGNWSEKSSTTIYIPKLTVAAFLAAVSVVCPYMSVAALASAASVFIAGGYKYTTIEVRSRLGADATYQYAQQEITMWGRHTKTGTRYHVYGPGIWTQKRPL